MVDLRGSDGRWIHLINNQTWFQFSTEQHHFYVQFGDNCPGNLLFNILLNHAVNVKKTNLCQYIISVIIIAAHTENLDICVSLSVVERFPVSAGVVLPANVFTGHRNATAKISLPDFPRDFRVDRGQIWFRRGCK